MLKNQKKEAEALVGLGNAYYADKEFKFEEGKAEESEETRGVIKEKLDQQEEEEGKQEIQESEPQFPSLEEQDDYEVPKPSYLSLKPKPDEHLKDKKMAFGKAKKAVLSSGYGQKKHAV